MGQPPRIWRKGERIDITYQGRVVTGRVELGSENGLALQIVFQALLGVFAGRMPVIWHESECEYRDIIMGGVVGISEPAALEERLQA